MNNSQANDAALSRLYSKHSRLLIKNASSADSTVMPSLIEEVGLILLSAHFVSIVMYVHVWLISNKFCKVYL